MSRRASIGSLLLLCLLVFAPAQQGQSQQPVFRVESQQIPLYVSVTDKKGRPIKNLTREDFTIEEDGVVQRLDIFQELDWTSDAPAESVAQPRANDVAVRGVAESPSGSNRYIVLRFDPNLGFRDLPGEDVTQSRSAIGAERGRPPVEGPASCRCATSSGLRRPPATS